MSSTIRIVTKRSPKARLQSILAPYSRRPRQFPWRDTSDPYKILVSEIMLQQTQVDRVVPYFETFVRRYPTYESLSRAPLTDVVRLWQGLGYNRRAKYLRDAALQICELGSFPTSYDALRALPGVGDYTAKAVRVFAFNQPEVMIETNIRAAYIHVFLGGRNKVSDSEIRALIESTLDTKKPRRFYTALMDYGSDLKKRVPNPSRKSAMHVKQKPFKGSRREVRGALMKTLSNGGLRLKLLTQLPFSETIITEELYRLQKEGLITELQGVWKVAE